MATVGHIKAEVLVRFQGAPEANVVGYIEIPLRVSAGMAREGEAWLDIKPDLSTVGADLFEIIAQTKSKAEIDAIIKHALAGTGYRATITKTEEN